MTGAARGPEGPAHEPRAGQSVGAQSAAGGSSTSLRDFASVLPAMRTRGGDTAAVIATVVVNRSELPLSASDRLVVDASGAVTGSFLPAIASRIQADALSCLAAKRSRLLSYLVDGESVTPAALQGGNLDVFFEVLDAVQRLIVVGGGHIAVPLVQFAKVLNFEVTVLDDRVEFASRERFPQADRVLHGPYRPTLSALTVDANTYVVLVTRGHVHDAACLELLISSPAAYIGMIGSKRRVKTVLAHVLGSDPPPEKPPRVHAPIGVDIGAQTPEEIALAIAAELIKVRRGGRAASLSDGLRP